MNKPETEEKKHVKLLTSVPALTNCVDISRNNEKERLDCWNKLKTCYSFKTGKSQ